MLVILLRLLQNKPSLPSIPQALKNLESCCLIQKRVRVRKSSIPCDSEGMEWGQIGITGRDSSCRKELSKQGVSDLRAPLWPLEVMGSCPLRCPSRGGRLENRSKHQRLPDWGWGGCQSTGAGRQDAEQVSFASEKSQWVMQGPWWVWFPLPSSLVPLRVAGERHTLAFPFMSPSLRNLMRRGGFGLRQGSGPPRCPALHHSNLTTS